MVEPILTVRSWEEKKMGIAHIVQRAFGVFSPIDFDEQIQVATLCHIKFRHPPLTTSILLPSAAHEVPEVPSLDAVAI